MEQRCLRGVCDTGWALCAGACVRTDTDAANSGACGIASNTTQSSVDGLCVVVS